jgi:hypothetical protein
MTALANLTHSVLIQKIMQRALIKKTFCSALLIVRHRLVPDANTL